MPWEVLQHALNYPIAGIRSYKPRTPLEAKNALPNLSDLTYTNFLFD